MQAEGPGQAPDRYPATERKLNQATRKKPEVNLAQTAAHGRGGLAGCLGSGWVSDNPSDKTGVWAVARQPRGPAALAAGGRAPFPGSGEVPSAGAAPLSPGFRLQFLGGVGQALLPWMLGLLREQEGHARLESPRAK